jgi:Na+/H+-translocating membrane pyrophosphatase
MLMHVVILTIPFSSRQQLVTLLGPKGSEVHKAAVIRDTIGIGDPVKDTSGLYLNILIKFMAVEVVLSHFFRHHY